jgi:predicted small lipoprotein YifL
MSKLNTFLWMPILMAAVCSALMGCGTKGPLYIPEQRYPQESNVPASDANKSDTNKIKSEKAAPTAPTQIQPSNKE